MGWYCVPFVFHSIQLKCKHVYAYFVYSKHTNEFNEEQSKEEEKKEKKKHWKLNRILKNK